MQPMPGVLRWGSRQGQRTLGWFPLAKKVAYLRRYAEISRQAAGRSTLWPGWPIRKCPKNFWIRRVTRLRSRAAVPSIFSAARSKNYFRRSCTATRPCRAFPIALSLHASTSGRGVMARCCSVSTSDIAAERIPGRRLGSARPGQAVQRLRLLHVLLQLSNPRSSQPARRPGSAWPNPKRS